MTARGWERRGLAGLALIDLAALAVIGVLAAVLFVQWWLI